MSDDVYYIRTGDKISKPFKIGIPAKVLIITFIMYVIWITYEFFRVLYLEEQIEKLRISTEAKYKVLQHYQSAIEELVYLRKDYEKTIEVFEQNLEDNNAKSN